MVLQSFRYVVLNTILAATVCQASPSDYASTNSAKTAPYRAEMISSFARATARTDFTNHKLKPNDKIQDMRNLRPHKYHDGASFTQFFDLMLSDLAKVGAQMSPFSNCMDYKIRGFCGREWCVQACAPIVGCVDLYCADLPTGFYREYHIPVAMADTTNVRGATAMQFSFANKTMVEAGQAMYERYAKNKMFFDPVRKKMVSLPELEMERTWGASVNALKARGKGNGIPVNLNLAQLKPSDIDAIIDAKNELRARYKAIDPSHNLDTFKGSGNTQPGGQGFVFATWQTPPGYPVGLTIDTLLHLIIAKEPPVPIFPPLPIFTSPYPYPGAAAKLYDFCHCKRRPAPTHFVGSEYLLPIVPSFNPLAFPNILARSPAVANWYTPGNSEFATKMTIQYRDPTSALNADIAGGAADLAVGGVPSDMFEGLQNLSSGTLPGRYRGNQHGWVDITHKVNQAVNTAASEEALLKAFKYAHMIWPKEYYDVTPGPDGDKVQWTQGRLADADWGGGKACKYIGHYAPEFKKANENLSREDIWNVGHLWKKVRCCNRDHPIWGNDNSPPIEDRNSSSCPAAGRSPF